MTLRRLAACMSLIGCLLSGDVHARDVRSDPTPPAVRTDSEFPVEIVRVDIGFSDESVMRGRFVPVRIWLTSRDRPREVTIQVTSLHDDTQDGTVTLVGATTPGLVTTHDLAVYLGSRRGSEYLDVSIQAEGLVRHRRFGTQGQADSDPLPLEGSQQLQVLAVGEVPSLAQSLRPLPPAPAQQTKKADDETRGLDPLSLLHQTQHSQLAPERLFSLPIVYDCLDVVAATAESLAQAEPRAREALLQWVRSGGSLLLVADGAGSEWMLPWGDAEHAPIALTEIRPLSPRKATLRTLAAPDSSTFSVNARSITLKFEGAKQGWSTKLGMNVVPAEISTAASASLLAVGPYGSGLIALLTIDPSRLGPTINLKAAELIYAECFSLVAPTKRIESVILGGKGSPFWGFDSPRQSAVATVLEQDTGDVPSLSVWPIALIGATTIGLGLLIGPIDAMLTRRRSVRGSTTWWTAMGWIAAASIVGLIIPSLSRSGESRLNQVSIIDAYCEPDGKAGREWRSELFSLYADAPLRTDLSGLAAGSWVHGVSSFDGYGWSGHRLSPLNMPLTTSKLGLPQAVPTGMSQSQWTLRTLHSTGGERASSLSVHVETGTATPTLKLMGLPEGASLRTEAHLVTALGDFTATVNAEGAIVATEMIPPTDARVSKAANSWEEGLNLRSPGRLSRIAELLPGSSERSGSHEVLRRSTRLPWCTLIVVIEGLPRECSLDGIDAASQKGTHAARLRITFPIDEATNESFRSLGFRSMNGTPQKGTP